jgi:hypothetical protein
MRREERRLGKKKRGYTPSNVMLIVLNLEERRGRKVVRTGQEGKERMEEEGNRQTAVELVTTIWGILCSVKGDADRRPLWQVIFRCRLTYSHCFRYWIWDVVGICKIL